MYLPRNAEKFIINPKIPLSGGVVPVSLRKRRKIQITKREFSSDLGTRKYNWQVLYCVSPGCVVVLNAKDVAWFCFKVFSLTLKNLKFIFLPWKMTFISFFFPFHCKQAKKCLKRRVVVVLKWLSSINLTDTCPFLVKTWVWLFRRGGGGGKWSELTFEKFAIGMLSTHKHI